MMFILRYPRSLIHLLAVCLFALGLAGGLVLPAFAQVEFPTPSSTTETVPVAPVKVNDRVLFQVAGTDQNAATDRADQINRRLQRLVNEPGEVLLYSEEDVAITPTAGGYVIKLGNETILTVTQTDVDYYLTPGEELATAWGTKVVGGVLTGRIARTGTLGDIGMLTLSALTDLVRSILQWSPRLLGAVILTLIFWPLARLARRAAQWATSSKRLDPNIRQLAVAIAFYTVWAMGLLAILSTLGIDSVSIATTVGVSGFILGFAFKDILAHFFAGMMMLLERQFSIGGDIVVGEFEGTVERVDLRALHLRTYDNRLVTIPNGQVFNSAVITISPNQYRRREFSITIAGNVDARQAMKAALDVTGNVDGVLPQPAPQVFASAVDAVLQQSTPQMLPNAAEDTTQPAQPHALANALPGQALTLRILFYTSNTHANPLGVVSECILRVNEEIARLEAAAK